MAEVKIKEGSISMKPIEKNKAVQCYGNDIDGNPIPNGTIGVILEVKNEIYRIGLCRNMLRSNSYPQQDIWVERRNIDPLCLNDLDFSGYLATLRRFDPAQADRTENIHSRPPKE